MTINITIEIPDGEHNIQDIIVNAAAAQLLNSILYSSGTGEDIDRKLYDKMWRLLDKKTDDMKESILHKLIEKHKVQT